MQKEKRIHPGAVELLEELERRYPEATMTPFLRRGRTDHIVLLPEAQAGWLIKKYPNVVELRQLASEGELGEEPPVAWERLGDKRYARLRLSPSRVTRPAVNLQQLPQDDNQLRKPLNEQFEAWLAKWSIGPADNCPEFRRILFGGFVLGSLPKHIEKQITKKAEVPRLGLDQNQHVGNRCHLILEGDKPASPFALHLVLYNTPTEPPMGVQDPGIATRFGARSHKDAETLIAAAPHDKVRFYLNRKRLEKPLSLPVCYIEYLTQNNLLTAVMDADTLLRAHLRRCRNEV